MRRETYITQTILGAIIVIIGFFLPWVSIGLLGISGYDIPRIADLVSGMASAIHDNESANGAKLYYLLYLMPICSGYIIIESFQRNRSISDVARIAILIMSAFVVYKLSTLTGEERLLERVGIGLWLVIGGSTYLIIVGLIGIQEQLSTTNTNNPTTNSINDDVSNKAHLKSELFSQLEKILKLKENGVLTEQQFETEKRKILEQLGHVDVQEPQETAAPVIPEAKADTRATDDAKFEQKESIPGESRKNKYVFISILILLLFLLIGGYFYFKSGENSSEILYDFSRTSDANFCNPDSLIPTDCGFGNLYLTKDGTAIYTGYCIGMDSTSYNIGKYVKHGTDLVCSFDKIYTYTNGCEECIPPQTGDPNSGKIKGTTNWTLTLKKLDCKEFDYYQPLTEAEKRDQPKAAFINGNSITTQSYVFHKTDLAHSKAYFSAVAKIKVLSKLIDKEYTPEIEKKKELPPVSNSTLSLGSSKSILGSWTGSMGKDVIKFTFEKLNRDSLTGYDEIKGGKRRPIIGAVKSNASSGYSIHLKEPGDDTWDGEYFIEINGDIQNGKGYGISFNKKYKADILVLKVQN